MRRAQYWVILSLFLPLFSPSNHHFLNLSVALNEYVLGKNSIDFEIPWFCYHAMHSNDQLFGLRLGFLGGPSSSSSSRSDMKSILTLRRHQRVHWLNHRLFNCSSLLTQQTSTELWKEFFNVAVHQQAAPFEKVKRRISQYHWGGDGCHKRELNTDRNRRLNVRETDAAGSSYHRVSRCYLLNVTTKGFFFVLRAVTCTCRAAVPRYFQILIKFVSMESISERNIFFFSPLNPNSDQIWTHFHTLFESPILKMEVNYTTPQGQWRKLHIGPIFKPGCNFTPSHLYPLV